MTFFKLKNIYSRKLSFFIHPLCPTLGPQKVLHEGMLRERWLSLPVTKGAIIAQRLSLPLSTREPQDAQSLLQNRIKNPRGRRLRGKSRRKRHCPRTSIRVLCRALSPSLALPFPHHLSTHLSSGMLRCRFLFCFSFSFCFFSIFTCSITHCCGGVHAGAHPRPGRHSGCRFT